MKERSRSRGGRSSREEEPVRRSRREKKRSRPRVEKVESVTRPQRRAAGEEEAKKPLVRGESTRETPRRKNRDNMPRRESEVSSRTSAAATRRHKARGEERVGRRTTRVGREMSSQPSSVASVPMPKSLPSLPSLSQNGGTIEDPQQLSGGFEESQGSNKRDADNPFHRSYSRVRENPVHKEREEKPLGELSNTFDTSQGGNTRGEPKSLGSFTRQSGRSLSSLKRVRRLSLGSLTSEEPTGVVRLPPGELEQVPKTMICNLPPAGRVGSINSNRSQWSFGGGSLNHSRETVNTAIVDFYQQADEEPVLKSRVSSSSRWLG